MTETQPTHDSPHNPKVDFERTDLNLGRMVLFGVVIMALIFAAMLIMYGLLGGFNRFQAAAAPTPLPLLELRPTPPLPRLQPNPIDSTTAEGELQLFRQSETEILTSYGWVDQTAGIARIPIERAMELLAAEAAR